MKSTAHLGIAAAIVLAGVAAVPVGASGPIGIYAIIERVVFEPDDTNPVRLQLWGTFLLADRMPDPSTSTAARGYLYFSLQSPSAGDSARAASLREWADLKAVAGTGQAVAFGTWRYVGRIRDGESPMTANAIVRVRDASQPVRDPIVYRTETGVVKLARDGSHGPIVRLLQAPLKP